MKPALTLLVLLVSPAVSMAGQCTDEVIESAKAAGMSDAEIQEVCQDSPTGWSALAGEWRVQFISSNYANSAILPIETIPSLSYWDIENAGGSLKITVKNSYNVAVEQETVAPYILGDTMEFELLETYYVLNLGTGKHIVGNVFDGTPSNASALGSIDMQKTRSRGR